MAVCIGLLSIGRFLDSTSWSYRNVGHFSFAGDQTSFDRGTPHFCSFEVIFQVFSLPRFGMMCSYSLCLKRDDV